MPPPPTIHALRTLNPRLANYAMREVARAGGAGTTDPAYDVRAEWISHYGDDCSGALGVLRCAGSALSELGSAAGDVLRAAADGLVRAGKTGVNCLADIVTCADNVKIAAGPVLAAGVTVLSGWGLVAACATLIGCVVAVPFLGTATVAGAYGTYRSAADLWWGPRRDEIYHELHGPFSEDD
jgi:hypothetical protein